MSAYMIVTGIIFLTLGIVWNASDLKNLLIKIVLILMSVWSLISLISEKVAPGGMVLENGMRLF